MSPLGASCPHFFHPFSPARVFSFSFPFSRCPFLSPLFSLFSPNSDPVFRRFFDQSGGFFIQIFSKFIDTSHSSIFRFPLSCLRFRRFDFSFSACILSRHSPFFAFAFPKNARCRPTTRFSVSASRSVDLRRVFRFPPRARADLRRVFEIAMHGASCSVEPDEPSAVVQFVLDDGFMTSHVFVLRNAHDQNHAWGVAG